MKSALLAPVVICVVLMAAIDAAAQELAPLTEDQSRALEQITERSTTSAISFLASDELEGRGTGSDGFKVAGAYVASRFLAAGLQGHNGSFYHHKVADEKDEASKADTDVADQNLFNVIGILPGSDPDLKDEAVVFSAHLDHLGTRENRTGDNIYNGADDNASGVTGVLSLADAYGSLAVAPKRTTIFIAYWGEEKGLLGSRNLVRNPIWPMDKIVANINLEMIGRPEPGANGKAWMTGWEHSDLGKLMNLGSQRIDMEIFEHPSHSNRLYRASDNWSFVQAGAIAHSFSAGSLHDDYHQPGDHWEKLELRHMTIVTRGLFAGSLPIADGQFTPVKTKKD